MELIPTPLSMYRVRYLTNYSQTQGMITLLVQHIAITDATVPCMWLAKLTKQKLFDTNFPDTARTKGSRHNHITRTTSSYFVVTSVATP